MSRIKATFATLRASNCTALMPYLTIGYPERESLAALVDAAVAGGADLLELGLPFSDPLADGPTVQASTQRALANGITLRECLAQTKGLRERGVVLPLVLMGYYNPIYQMGIEAFAAAAAEAGADGVIVPDLPPEEAVALDEALAQHGLDYIYMLAPTSDESRLRLVAERARGFIYLVALVGITGARTTLADEAASFVARVRAAVGDEIPLAIGFGIGSAQAAAEAGALADGVIVGTALIKRIGDAATAAAEAEQFIAELRAGLDG